MAALERCRGATRKLENKEKQQLVIITSRRGADYIADGPAGRKLSGHLLRLNSNSHDGSSSLVRPQDLLSVRDRIITYANHVT